MIEATWFIDPPYQNAGVHYVHSMREEEYESLADWSKSLRGQVMVCEASGATWLPFSTFMAAKAGYKRVSHEVMWTND